MAHNNTDAVDLRQALFLAYLVLDWESQEAAQHRGRADSWAKDCQQAAVLLRRLAAICDRLHKTVD